MPDADSICSDSSAVGQTHSLTATGINIYSHESAKKMVLARLQELGMTASASSP